MDHSQENEAEIGHGAHGRAARGRPEVCVQAVRDGDGERATAGAAHQGGARQPHAGAQVQEVRVQGRRFINRVCLISCPLRQTSIYPILAQVHMETLFIKSCVQVVQQGGPLLPRQDRPRHRGQEEEDEAGLQGPGLQPV